MARFTYDILEPGKNANESLARLEKEFIPLHAKAWHENKRGVYAKEYAVNAGAFAGTWLNNTLKVFVAYEETRPAGYLMGTVFRPMEYNGLAFQVEDWYTGGNTVMRDGLFDFLDGALRILGCDEVRLTLQLDGTMPDLGPAWKEKTRVTIVRFVKE